MQITLGVNQEKKLALKPGEDWEIVLAGRGAKVAIEGIWQGQNSVELGSHLAIIHKAPETVSKVWVRGVLFDQSEAYLDGLIRIEKGAVLSQGVLRVDFLLFDQAKARPQPALEILENEVRASHAATVSRVDEGQIFYLMSRGLTKNKAEKMIVQGFLTRRFETDLS